MYAYVLFNLDLDAYRKEIRSFPEIAARLLPPSFNVRPNVLETGDFILFSWHGKRDMHGTRNRINPGAVRHSQKGTFFTTGYLAEGLIDVQTAREQAVPFVRDDDNIAVFDLIHPTTGGIKLSDSTGGVGANVWISSDGSTGHCWSTQPPAVPTFYAKNREGFCVVGSRPRLVHAASMLTSGLRLSRDYLPKYVTSGFALDGETPYPGTKAVPPNASIKLRRAKSEISDYVLGDPEPISQQTPLEYKAQLLAGLLTDACWPARALSSARIFLSGGKDSRAIACALSGESNIAAFTIGSVDQGEGFAAQEVASAIGCSFQTRKQKIISDPIKAAAASHLGTDGLGLNFAHQYNFLPDLRFLDGLPSFHGHGHLLRGGFARTMIADNEFLHNSLFTSFLSPFASDSARSGVKPHLERWLTQRAGSFKDSRDVLFYSNKDFRLGLFTAPSSLDLTSRTFMVYPLLDERISRFAGQLAVYDRVSERVVFAAMQKLNRTLTELPLFGEIWRFDRDPQKRDFPDSDHNFQEGFSLRQPRQQNKFAQHAGSKAALQYDADRPWFSRPSQLAAQFVLDSSARADLHECVTDDCWRELEKIASTGRNTERFRLLDVDSRFNLSSFLNRIFLAASLVDLHW